MRYVYRKHPSKLATLMVGFGAGSRVEFGSKYNIGMAHLMEHARFLGTELKDNKTLAREMALVGGNWNAFTCQDLVCYHISIPEENLEAGCRILSDVVLRPCFPADKFDKEKEIVCQEVRMYDDDIDSLVSHCLHSKVFDNSLHSPVVGFEQTVRQTTRQDILDFNAEFYGPNQMAIVLAAPNDYEGLITQYFGPNNGAFERKAKNTEVKYASDFETEVIKDGLIQDTICVGFGSPAVFGLSAPENEAKCEVFNRVFGAGDVSRLFMKVREDLGLVYGISSWFGDHLDGSLFGISTLTEPGNKDRVLEAINGEVARMLKEPPSTEELSMAKNKYKSRTYSMMDSSAGVANLALGELFFDSKPTEEVLADVDRVSADDLVEVAQVLFSGNRYQVIGRGKDEA